MTCDVVLGLSFETWDDMVRREFARPPDRMAQYLLHSDAVGRLLVANPWRSVPSQLKRRFGTGRDAPFPRRADAHLVRPIRARRDDRSDLDSLETSYWHYSHVIDRAARRRGLRNPALITFNPLFAAFGDLRGYRSATFVARDDWASYHGHPHMHSAYRHCYELIRERNLRVSAVSEVLLSRIDPAGARAVVPNGVDPAVWSEAGGPTPELDRFARPLALYSGTVDERISIEALKSLVEVLNGGTVVLIGPSEPAVVALLRSQIDNLVLLDPMKQSRLAAYVAAADVCVLPHVDSRLTRAMSPLKVYEYVAAGRPVAATDLPPVRGIDPSIQLAPTPADFGAAARRALQQGPASQTARSRFIAANSWDARCKVILELAVT